MSKVLIVDDDKDISELVSLILKKNDKHLKSINILKSLDKIEELRNLSENY